MKITVAPVYTKIRSSLKSIHYRLYFALLILALVPTVYTTFRTYWIGQLPDQWSFSIAGQLSWVNLLYEVLKEAIIRRVSVKQLILPVRFFTGRILLLLVREHPRLPCVKGAVSEAD